MFCYKIGICCTDLYYSVKLMEYFNGHEDIPIRASAFSSWQSVSEYLSKNSLDLIVMDENISSRQPAVCDTDDCKAAIAYFSEERDEYNRIFKYQNVRLIASEITHYLGKDAIALSKGCMWIGVYSPVGRCGKTSLAKSLVRHFGSSLYVGLEDYPTDISGDEEENGELFLYYLASMNENILKLIKNNRADLHENDCIIASSCCLERHISNENLKWFKKTISESKKYRIVVLDMGISVISSQEMFEVFDRILVPVSDDDHAKKKVAKFSESIGKNKEMNIADRIKYIKLTGTNFEEGYIEEMIEKGAI